jgi:hypothetical protein
LALKNKHPPKAHEKKSTANIEQKIKNPKIAKLKQLKQLNRCLINTKIQKNFKTKLELINIKLL